MKDGVIVNGMPCSNYYAVMKTKDRTS